jgi:hypothetical protein
VVAAKRPAEQFVHRVVSSATWPGAQIAAFSRSHSPLPAAGILPIEQFTHSEEPAGATKVEMQLWHCDLFVCAMDIVRHLFDVIITRGLPDDYKRHPLFKAFCQPV